MARRLLFLIIIPLREVPIIRKKLKSINKRIDETSKKAFVYTGNLNVFL